MNTLDWLVLGLSQLAIIGYGIWKSRGSADLTGYFLSNRDMKWWTIGLSIMATQASAITFLSTPGQAFGDGMRFVQFYFGLPLAMVILSITAVPIYHKLSVYTAYEYLEHRFDLKNRVLGALLFLSQRGLAAGLTIYAPSIILSTLLGWDIRWMITLIGLVVIVYTVSGGTKAVGQTHKLQMVTILSGMLIATVLLVLKLPDQVDFMDALHLAGEMQRLEVVDLEFDPNSRYNLWSGLLGGTFLALSYFGTDQSQVQRYLGGRSVTESRMGLVMNGLVKVPMQFCILLIGALMFVFYQFHPQPVFFNEVEREQVMQSEYGPQFQEVARHFQEIQGEKQDLLLTYNAAREKGNTPAVKRLGEEIRERQARASHWKDSAKAIMKARDPAVDANDLDYIFISYVLDYLPPGLVGLLISVILMASMSSTSGELNALASTTMIDVYRRLIESEVQGIKAVKISRVLTVAWGIYAILFAQFASQLGNLIQAVNILGSLFYGTILGIFLVAFYLRRLQGTAVFIAALIAESVVVLLYLTTDVAYLWYNLIGCALVVLIALALHAAGLKGGSPYTGYPS